MEFDELFVPPDIEDDYAAGVLTRLFGGIIPRLHGDGDTSIVASNWLEAIFTVFNTFCLLGMLVVLSYTIYAMVFDTAADGKAFGQSADTKYTILRTLGGVIGFVPVVGGFSLIQVAFLWLVLQGSALADVTWRQMSNNMLAGTPLVSGTFNRIPPETLPLVRQFGAAFDTLVTGHLCGLNGNSISQTIDGVSIEDEGDWLAAISTQGASGGPIRLRPTPIVTEDVSSAWNSISGRQAVGMSYQMAFSDDGTAYSGRDNYCGAVRATDSYIVRGADGMLEKGLLAVRSESQFMHLSETVLPDLSDAAYDVAAEIYQGEREAETLLEPSREAVYAAVSSYLSGPGVATSLDTGAVESAHDALREMVVREGWMMAPVWQRGVASTVTTIEMPGDSLELTGNRNNSVADFLSGRGYLVSRRDSAMGDLLVKADADQDTWNELSGYVRNLSVPDAETPLNVAMGGVSEGGIPQAITQSIYSKILEVFSPVATETASGVGFVDPMLQVQKQGMMISSAGGVALGIGVGGSIATENIIGWAVTKASGTDQVASAVTGGLMTLGVTLLIAGLIMTIILPLVMMIYFYTAVISWLFQALETLFAWPLLLLRLFMPSREGTAIGSDISSGLLAGFAVFMKPFFIIVGLLLAMMVMSVALTYLNDLFGRLIFFDGVSGTDSAVEDVLGDFGYISWAMDSTMGLVTMVFLLILYVLVAFLTVLYTSQIISEFGEFAMNLIGATASRYTQPGAIADKTMLAGGLGYAGARNIGANVGQLGHKRAAAGRLLPKDAGGGAGGGRV